MKPLYLSDMRLHSVYIPPEWYSTKFSVYTEAPSRSPTAYLFLAEKVPLSCAFYMYWQMVPHPMHLVLNFNPPLTAINSLSFKFEFE